MTFARSLGCIAAALCFSMAAAAEETPPPGTPEGYVRTGHREDCVRLRTVKRIKILNETQVLFRVSGGAWLQEPSDCVPLQKHYGFSYNATSLHICSDDAITVVNPRRQTALVGTCKFTRFQWMTEEP